MEWYILTIHPYCIDLVLLYIILYCFYIAVDTKLYIHLIFTERNTDMSDSLFILLCF